MTQETTRQPVPNREPEVVARRALSFGANARLYTEHRPDYPTAAITWALAPVAGRGRLRVLDLGAGTGQLTGGLLAAGVDAVAVEPDEAMLAELRKQLPEIEAFEGRAERIPLPDHSVDAVLAAASFHWFDRSTSMPEIARVLRPGGVFAALWNYDDDRVGWVSGYCDHIGPDSRITLADQWFDAAAYGPFEEPVEARFRHVHRRTAESLTQTAGTMSMALIVSAEERRAKLAEIYEYLRSQPETATGEFDHPLVTLVLRTRLTSAPGQLT
jgi:SAM-dependent methyltransferase